MAIDTESPKPPWVYLVLWSGPWSPCIQRAERLRLSTLGLRPHSNLNRVGLLGLMGVDDSEKWEDIIV